MNIRTIASLAIAIFLGLVAVILVRGLLTAKGHGRAQSSAAAVELSPVVVAAVRIDRGAALSPVMLKVVNYPRDSLPPGAFHTVEQLTGKGVPARMATRTMEPNEPVLATRLSGSAGKTNLSGTLTPGMRAVSVRSSDVAGVGGFILPGDRVDVMLTRTTGGEPAVTLTQVLAENALVLGVDQSNELDADKAVVAKTITLEVSPDQAQSLTLAQAVGTVSLSLRQFADGGPLARRATTVTDLGGFGVQHVVVKKVAPPPPKPGPKPGTMEVQVTRGVEATGYTVGVTY